MAARLPGLLAAAIAACVAVLYLVVILGEDEPNPGGTIAFVTGSLVLGALLALAGAFADDPYWRRLAFGIAAAVVAVIAFLGAFSIGPLLLPAFLLLAFAFARG